MQQKKSDLSLRFFLLIIIEQTQTWNMSFLIHDQSDTTHKTTQEHLKQSQITSTNNFEDRVLAQLRCFRQFALIAVVENQRYKYLSFRYYDFYYTISSILSVKIQKLDGSMKAHLYFTQSQHSYFRIKNPAQIRQALKILTQLSSIQNDFLIRFSLDARTGQVKISLPILITSLRESKNLNDAQIKLLSMIKKIIRSYSTSINRMIFRLLQMEQRQIKDLKQAEEPKILYVIERYREILNVASFLSQNSVGPQQQQLQYEIKKRQSVQKLVLNKKAIDKPNTKALSFYGDWLHYPQQEYQLRPQQLKYVKAMISMPVFPKPKNINENAMILNHIKIKDIHKVHFQKINEGGFATIECGPISYWYVYSSDGEVLSSPSNEQFKSAQSPLNMLTKMVVVKKEFNHPSSKYFRNKHQIKILKRIKNGTCIYLPKYYIPINTSNINNTHSLQSAVMMDYIAYQNLGSYLQNKASIISLQTKLVIMFSIVQALRYLRWFNIVHLDLKPQNIMLFIQLLVKLIDFGQSFHPDVCKKEVYKPGFSIPYSCPQLFTDGPYTFTDKSDVFSLGVIFHQILYNRYPFQINHNTQQIDHAMKNFIGLCYYCPEDLQILGQYRLLRVLNSITMKCLDLKPQNRPQLDWMALILKQMLQMLY